MLDFDGVLTDGRVIVSDDGRESVICCRRDGLGIEMLRRAGIDVLILSGETSAVVGVRARKLKVAVIQGVQDKPAELERELARRGVRPADVVYVGDDVNDLECMKRVGCAVAPADAHDDVAAAADVVLGRCGGAGAVRELADMILARHCDNARPVLIEEAATA